jgi:hypothetical protein
MKENERKKNCDCAKWRAFLIINDDKSRGRPLPLSGIVCVQERPYAEIVDGGRRTQSNRVNFERLKSACLSVYLILLSDERTYVIRPIFTQFPRKILYTRAHSNVTNVYITTKFSSRLSTLYSLSTISWERRSPIVQAEHTHIGYPNLASKDIPRK